MRILEYAEFNDKFPSEEEIRECFDDITDELDGSRILKIRFISNPYPIRIEENGVKRLLSKKCIKVRISLGINKKWDDYGNLIKFFRTPSSKKTIDDNRGEGSYEKVMANIKNALERSNIEVMEIVDILKNCIERIKDSYDLTPLNFILMKPCTDGRGEYIYHGYFYKNITDLEKSKLERHFKRYIIDNYTYNDEPKNPLEGIFDN